MSGEIQDDILGGPIGTVHRAANGVRERARADRWKHLTGQGKQQSAKTAATIPRLSFTSIRVLHLHIQSGRGPQMGQAGGTSAQRVRSHGQALGFGATRGHARQLGLGP